MKPGELPPVEPDELPPVKPPPPVKPGTLALPPPIVPPAPSSSDSHRQALVPNASAPVMIQIAQRLFFSLPPRGVRRVCW